MKKILSMISVVLLSIAYLFSSMPIVAHAAGNLYVNKTSMSDNPRITISIPSRNYFTDISATYLEKAKASSNPINIYIDQDDFPLSITIYNIYGHYKKYDINDYGTRQLQIFDHYVSVKYGYFGPRSRTSNTPVQGADESYEYNRYSCVNINYTSTEEARIEYGNNEKLKLPEHPEKLEAPEQDKSGEEFINEITNFFDRDKFSDESKDFFINELQDFYNGVTDKEGNFKKQKEPSYMSIKRTLNNRTYKLYGSERRFGKEIVRNLSFNIDYSGDLDVVGLSDFSLVINPKDGTIEKWLYFNKEKSYNFTKVSEGEESFLEVFPVTDLDFEIDQDIKSGATAYVMTVDKNRIYHKYVLYDGEKIDRIY